jgi:hypothetical protein
MPLDCRSRKGPHDIRTRCDHLNVFNNVTRPRYSSADLTYKLQQMGKLTADMSQTHGAARLGMIDRWNHLTDQDRCVKLIKPLVCPASPMTRRSRRTPKHNVPSARICEIPPFQNNPKSSRVVEMEATPTGP